MDSAPFLWHRKADLNRYYQSQSLMFFRLNYSGISATGIAPGTRGKATLPVLRRGHM